MKLLGEKVSNVQRGVAFSQFFSNLLIAKIFTLEKQQ